MASDGDRPMIAVKTENLRGTLRVEAPRPRGRTHRLLRGRIFLE
jgi:hypothetical protein